MEKELKALIGRIQPIDRRAMESSRKRWNSIAKPLHSLGKLEDAVIQIAGITGDADVKLGKKALVILCADNGVVAEGVTQTGQEVTAIVAENFLSGGSSAAIMCERAGISAWHRIRRCRIIRLPAAQKTWQKSRP